MWCDDFDMDLYTAVPAAREVLAPVAAVELQTHGGETDGKLNHPSCWSHGGGGYVSFFGFRAPCKPEVYSTSHPVVRCTFEEAVRDLWCHGMLMIVEGHPVWDSERVQSDFQLLMFHLRGWHRRDEREVEHARGRVLDSLRRAVVRFRVLVAEHAAAAGARA